MVSAFDLEKTTEPMELAEVRAIRWCRAIPIGVVWLVSKQSEVPVCLLHDSVLARHRIGVGSLLRISSPGNLFLDVVQSEGYVPTSSPDVVFRQWFLFRNSLLGVLPHHLLHKLFTHGIRTVQALRTESESLPPILGIGPVARQRIRVAMMCIE
jgi:hypothetical protein